MSPLPILSSKLILYLELVSLGKDREIIDFFKKVSGD